MLHLDSHVINQGIERVTARSEGSAESRTASETIGGRPFILSATECRELVLASGLSEIGSNARQGNIIWFTASQ